jgi:mRNA interferase MazF
VVIERGQIYWCGLDPVQGHEQSAKRPAIVVSADAYNASRSPLVAIVPLTRAPAKNPIHVAFSSEETGLDSPSTALVDHARFVDRRRLRGVPAGRLQAAALALLDGHLALVFGLSA